MEMEKNHPDAINDHLEKNEEAQNVYLAFCDILRFSAMAIKDFDKILDVYRDFGESITEADYLKDVEITMYSDSVLITGNDLYRVASAVQILWFIALSKTFMIRGRSHMGGIGRKNRAKSNGSKRCFDKSSTS